MNEYKCIKEDTFDLIKENVNRNKEEIQELKKEVNAIKINDRGMQEIIKNLETTLEKIVDSLDKLKWWFLTGLIGPIILAFILAKIKL